MRRPEILAPAGDRDALAAALAAGADAVYLGLDDGFNARARAANFPSTQLAETAAQVHRAGAKLYITLNTLVFEPELAIVEELIRRVAASGADAIIVQDPAVALLARRICPQLDVHASTQMTASSPAAANLLAPLGLSRVVVPRELSVDEIRAYRAATPLELEVFVHGALCVAWSGQCLSSEAWGGRSANRGQCAQACRLPYELIVDGRAKDLGEVAYLLSPRDLVGLDAIPQLAEAGVASLKIEGRLKGPAYVATAVSQYKRATGAEYEPPVDIPQDREALLIAYSRGASTGFLTGADHQTLVEGRFPRHRGVLLGPITLIEGNELEVARESRAGESLSDVRAGMGVVFDAGTPEQAEQGGPIFAASPTARGYRLRFGTPGPDLSKVHVGDRVWISSDPRVTRAGDKAAEAGRGPLGRIAVELHVSGREGQPLVVTARVPRAAPGDISASTPHDIAASTADDIAIASASALQPARGAGITRDLLADKLGAFGGTPFHLGELTVELAAGLHLPVSELKEIRRQLVPALEAAIARIDRTVERASVIAEVRPAAESREAEPLLVALCRNDEQLDAVLDGGCRDVELDWMELVGLAKAVDRAKARGARVTVATVRIQKPGEDKIDAHLARLAPDGVLVRSWGSLAYFADKGIPLHGDFSLNVTNSLTAGWVLGHGVETVTAAHDLDRDQLLALLAAAPRGRVAVTIHHHIPTFHTEHCVYAHLLSDGRDFKTCGRPCEQHQVALRDRVGLVHPVIVDVGCRNTVFNAQAQSAAGLVPELLARGVRRFRIELVRERADEAARLYTSYAQLVAGTAAPSDVVRAAAVHEQFGVTRGTMRTLTVLR
jgi:putative protease